MNTDLKEAISAFNFAMRRRNTEEAKLHIAVILRLFREGRFVTVSYDEKRFQPYILCSNDGEHFLPVFTSADEISDAWRKGGLTFTEMPGTEIAEAVLKMTELKGIVINVFSESYTLSVKELKAVIEHR